MCTEYRSAWPFLICLLVMMFPTVGDRQKPAGQEGMQNSGKKYRRRNEVERLLPNPVFKNRPQPIGLILAIALKIFGEFYRFSGSRMSAAGNGDGRENNQEEGHRHPNNRTAKASQHAGFSLQL